MEQRYKYPKTSHLPWSDSITIDDFISMATDYGAILNRAGLPNTVIITEKMDGENTTLYRDGIHARSIDSADHPSRHWLKAFHAGIKDRIPPDYRICGENLYAKHSIYYGDLHSYFLVFNIWRGHYCFSWAHTLDFCRELGLMTVPVLYQGIYDKDKAKLCFTGQSVYGGEQEGYVIRPYVGFYDREFAFLVQKYVRPNHVQTDDHWLTGPLVKNGLRKE